MTTYLVLSLAVLVPVCAAAIAVLVRRGVLLPALIGVAALVALTAVFDTVIVGTGIVAYDPGRILGVRIGVAPIEDFAYCIAAALALPALWTLLASRLPPRQRRRSGRSRDATGGRT